MAVTTHRIGVNQRVSIRSPKLPAKNEKASHCGMEVINPNTLSGGHGFSYLQRIGASKNGDDWHVNNSCHRPDNPGFEVQTAEPVLLD